MPRLSRCLLLLAPLVAAACSSSHAASGPAAPFESGSPWPKFRGNAAQTGLGLVHASQQGGQQWSFPTGAGIFSSPIVAADGTIYFGSASQTFYALNADGTTRWTIPTGEIIDSAGLLDDQGRVYFGSGDGMLRAADAQSGQIVWTTPADSPQTTGAFINWFEGNVAMAADGTLYVPNDNFRVYAVDRGAGGIEWGYTMPDQTWSLPAVDVQAGTIYVGNNNLLPILGKNTFAIDPDGTTDWSMVSLGTVAASPLLDAADAQIVVGGFDGYARAYATADGTVLWELATRDHIYSSPAQLPDGTIVQPSADGTIYAVSPSDGTLVWSYDTGSPIRSSPAVDADGHVYVGGGDGNLYVLNPDGSLRFAMQLIDDVRNNLNASPALGQSAVYIGGESGEMFSVPYDWCLRPENASDTRCVTSIPTPADGSSLTWVNAFGNLLPAAPASVPGNAPITLQLAVRSGGMEQLAILDSTSVNVTLDPPAMSSVDVSVDVSGDGKFLTITPTVAFAPGPLSIQVQANYLTNLQRAGLALSGGSVGGSVSAMKTTTVAAPSGGALDTTAIYELSRLSIPLPTVMPSYNQIGFDQLHYLLGTVQSQGTTGIAWMIGAKVPAAGMPSVVDPATQAIFPLAFDLASDLATMNAADGLQVDIMNFTLPFQTFRLSLGFLQGGAPTATSQLTGSAVCAQIPTYGAFLEQLGLCNPQTDVIRVLGASNVALRTDIAPPPAAGTATFAASADAITATVTGSQVMTAQHLASLLVVDASTGLPVTLEYGTGTTRTTNADGTLASVSVPTKGVTLPAAMQVVLIIDTTSVAQGTLP
jgi:outer membrane protein assembly factor BamB